MKHKDEFAGQKEQDAGWELLEPELRESLDNFKASVHAWSDAAMSRPRTVPQVAVRKTWRLAAGWALGAVLVAGGVTGGVYERHHRQELARIAHQREVERQQQLAADRAREEEDLMAQVDNDISREVPSALEPLASLMDEDQNQSKVR
jgi:hypothetical protein